MDPYIFEKCNGCRFFLHRSGRGCVCRRYPTPTPTSEDGWCGPSADAIANVRCLTQALGINRETINAIEAVCTWAERSP